MVLWQNLPLVQHEKELCEGFLVYMKHHVCIGFSQYTNRSSCASKDVFFIAFHL